MLGVNASSAKQCEVLPSGKMFGTIQECNMMVQQAKCNFGQHQSIVSYTWAMANACASASASRIAVIIAVDRYKV